MARHWHAAGDLDRALDASVRAGAAYTRMYAFGDALRGVHPRARPGRAGAARPRPSSAVRLLAAEAATTWATPTAARALLERVRARHRRPAHPRARRRADRRAAPHVRRRRGRRAGLRRGARPAARGRDQRARGADPGWAGAARRSGWSRLDDAERGRHRGAAHRAGRRGQARGGDRPQRPRDDGGAPRRPRPGGATCCARRWRSPARSRTPGPRRGVRQPQPRPRDGRPARRVRGAGPGRDRRADPVRPAARAGQPAAATTSASTWWRRAGSTRPARSSPRR